MIPDFMDMIMFEIAENFSTEAYMLVTKIQGMLWSLADIVIIYVVLKTASLIRKKNRQKKIIFRYIFLWLSAILTPFLVFTETPKQFIILESVIFSLQFAVIIYSVFVETKGIIIFLRKIVVDSSQ